MKLNEIRDFGDWFNKQGRKTDEPAHHEPPQRKRTGWSYVAGDGMHDEQDTAYGPDGWMVVAQADGSGFEVFRDGSHDKPKFCKRLTDVIEYLHHQGVSVSDDDEWYDFYANNEHNDRV